MNKLTLCLQISKYLKNELKEYLEEIGQSWHDDLSNDSLKYKRNRVRHELVPLLNELAGSPCALSQRLNTLSKQSAAYRSWLDSSALTWEDVHIPYGSTNRERHVLPLGPLQCIPEAVKIEILYRFITRYIAQVENKDMKTSIPYHQMERVLAHLGSSKSDWILHLKKDICVRRIGEVLKCEPLTQKGCDTKIYLKQFCIGNEEKVCVEVSSCINDSLVMSGCRVRIHLHNESLDCDWVPIDVFPGTRFIMRLRRDGDHFSSTENKSRLSCVHTVSQFLRIKNVPRHLRNDVIVLEDVNDEQSRIVALWVPSTDDTRSWIVHTFDDGQAKPGTFRYYVQFAPEAG